ncbi:carbohydrate ABC transporter permease [Paenibacillus dendritiformis]|uniref:Binding-protein-dependent transport systems inner membrane component n=1 Tax=Paenibacillus dendritiformis C454 TaxID=1131935 RepID=H3SDB1_9BACL|nr:carbohydrate ABC transporter permease [Paenibacillus dendritiformis]EHQ62877.1 binding-protein-dependent transport systems inner membrane component [Paenibacillus dendritiformis C454]PZM63745.1 carbohydrate ABC transporter permease [Paenibacillus dendritiformis]TDL51018.1 carbohydrate ABC transporter permease [Paenibacillus dendritiformis]WGU97529.1 carbohydrate ABC transporter permease [Paenibacillus dendritiformis]CAH8769227.1 carbohydrate ABC transporter permease [Paenibacillus dendritif
MTKAMRFIPRFLINLFLWVMSLSCIFPVIWMIYSSLKTQQEFNLNIISLPTSLNFQNYIDAFRIGKMDTYFVNSVFVTVLTVIFTVVLSFLAAYILARFDFPGRNLVYFMFLAGMLIPIHGLLIPVFVEFKALGLLDQRITLVLPYVAFNLSMGIFLFENFIKSVPLEVEEAAAIDGSSTTRRVLTIVLPMCLPVISTAIILYFLGAWNEFPFALVLIKSPELRTLPVGLTNFNGQFTVNYPQMMAAMVIVVLPVILTYLAFYKKIMQGMTAGAVKG